MKRNIVYNNNLNGNTAPGEAAVKAKIKIGGRQEEVMRMTRYRSSGAVSCMLLAALLSAALLASCKEKPFELKNPAVVGKWEGIGQTAELFPDGKITLGADWQSKQSTGRYDFVDEDTIRVRFKSSRPQEYNFALAGDNLKVTRADGTLVGDFTRVHRP